MAPLSILPGRIRFETRDLLGRKDFCLFFEERVRALDGVGEASANPRTGRVLVRFDEGILNRDTIIGEIRGLLEDIRSQAEEAVAGTCSGACADAQARKDENPGGFARHLLLDVALHMILPRPLDILVPAAASALRR